MTTDVHHPLFARFYERLSRLAEPQLAPHRRRLLRGLAGTVVEIGAGNGMNFRHYPVEVDRVIAVEPEAHLRRLALGQARRADVEVEVVDGLAARLPLEDASVDAAVASLVLCSVEEQAAALAEIRRVVRPGGHLRFLEHVAALTPTLGRVQRALDATVWPALGGGCHTSRDTLAAIKASSFEIIWSDRLRLPDTRVPMPTAPHVIGAAVSPSS